jgi:hypothetical protein
MSYTHNPNTFFASIMFCLYLSFVWLTASPPTPFCYRCMPSLHLPRPFFSYIIHPYSSNVKRQDSQCQRQWPQQRHESTTSRVVVGHANPSFRNLGENATDQFIGATHERNCHVKKEEVYASKTLGQCTKKQHETPRALQVGYRKCNWQPLSEMNHTYRDFLDFVPPPSFGRIPASTDKKCYDNVERGHLATYAH